MDIDIQKTAEENLRSLDETVEERVRQRTSELEAANKRLMELDRMKSMFIASMSHELRTPLNSIIGFSHILLNQWAGPLNEEQKENLASILRSGKHLLALINDIIDLSKIEAGMVEPFPEEFDLYDIVAEVVDIFGNDISEKGIEIKVGSIHQHVYSDRTRLLQCLLNLVGNALKFTEKGTISIDSETSTGGNTLRITVEDTGIGISQEELGKLFTPCFRIDSLLKTKMPGTGLGLYLTWKLITEVLQGELTVTSAPDKGSLFTLTFPVTFSRNP